MDVIETIRTRKSIRKFLDLPVEWDKVGMIIDAGRLAPSSGNIQIWKFIVVRSAEKRQAIADSCLQQQWMTTAPVHIVVCADIKKIRRYYGIRGERLYAIQDCAAAAENMLLTAHALGLGTCWVGAFDEEKIAGILGIPPDVEVRPQGIIVIGYPDEKPAEQEKLRIENVTFLEGYSRQSFRRIGDVDYVLWDFRVLEKGLRGAGQAATYVSKDIQRRAYGQRLGAWLGTLFKPRQKEQKPAQAEQAGKEGEAK